MSLAVASEGADCGPGRGGKFGSGFDEVIESFECRDGDGKNSAGAVEADRQWRCDEEGCGSAKGGTDGVGNDDGVSAGIRRLSIG